MNSELLSALSGGAIAVTPNRRLARYLLRDYARTQRLHGRDAWATPSILPFGAWVERLWLDALADEALPHPSRLLSASQSAYLWARIVADDTARTQPLVDLRGAASLAAEAWSFLHGWGDGRESWRRALGTAVGDDATAFVRWSDAYAAVLEARSAIDHAQILDALADCAARVAAWRNASVVLVGFVERSPQQERFLGALQTEGARVIARDALHPEPATPLRVAAATPVDEIESALTWARAQVQATPEATIAVAVEDLAERRNEVRMLAEEVLSPELQWPGAEGQPRPYNVSLGESLAHFPVVAHALDLITFARAPLPLSRAAVLLRSPYLPGAAEAWTRRAAIERIWLEQGRRQVSLMEAIATLRQYDHALAERWCLAREHVRIPSKASPREWSESWRTWLARAGWPGERTLSSAEYQVHGAWDDLLTEFAALGAVEGRLGHAEATAALRALADNALFQPEQPEAPIQILGILEATGLPFDGLWVAGLAAERWPSPPRPNPFLPLPWQRGRNAPRSNASRELEYAKALAPQWLRAARRVVFSHAVNVEDHQRTPSALIAGFDALPSATWTAPPSTARTMHAAAPVRETLFDDRAPALPPGSRAPGGAALIEKQSECPFRAMASHRLRVEPWPLTLDGLSAIERGDLMHRTLAALWSELRDHATLASLSPEELRVRIDSAVATACASGGVPPARWRTLPPLIAAGEAKRIAELVARWIESFERPRRPFAVRHIELPSSLKLAGLSFSLRLDRVDALEGGGVAIIDYKTGRATATSKWFGDRPQAPQLALYTFAFHAASPSDPVRAVAYAQLHPGDLRLHGIAADTSAWSDLAQVSTVGHGLSDWASVEMRWADALTSLAEEVAEGYAAVAPRDPRVTCRRCGLQALCRIGGPVEEAPEDGDE